MQSLRFFIALVLLLLVANCGEGNGLSIISIAPTQPFILSVDREFPTGVFGEIITIQKPNTTFQIRINNQGNPNPLTIVGLTLTVTGPKGVEVIAVDPAANLFTFDGTNFRTAPRAFFAVVPPFQAGFCMNKFTYFDEDPNAPRTCADMANDPSILANLGKSAANTSEPTGDPNSCCPAAEANLSNIFVLVGGLQNFGQEEVIPASQNYTINATFTGYFGTFIEPIANFNTQVFFNARSD